MTGPDLTPEQRDRLWAWYSLDQDWAMLEPLVARMLADARAEGDRQGAARVTAAIKAVADQWERENQRPNGAGDQVQAGVWAATKQDVADIRTVLAQAAAPTDQP